ncbi:YutD family protein [Paenibacillus beijingensis]|uniref:YutD family protein n=1 Tax=Paenibacillus beijingensis TaxID=1126833 RepID=UPI0009E18E2D|nr:YutD family protein [Paenibacillus beijingensis]
MILIGGKSYELVHEHKNAWNPEVFRERYSEVLDRYDFIIGDWGYNQLRLKGFFRDNHPKATKDSAYSAIMEYVNEYCNFGCAYFVLEKTGHVQGQKDTVFGDPDGLELDPGLGEGLGESRREERQTVGSDERIEPVRREYRSNGDRERRKDASAAPSLPVKDSAGAGGKDGAAKGANGGRKASQPPSERKKDGNNGSPKRSNPAGGDRKEQLLGGNRKESAASAERRDNSGGVPVSSGGKRKPPYAGERRQQQGGDKQSSQEVFHSNRASSRQE